MAVVARRVDLRSRPSPDPVVARMSHWWDDAVVDLPTAPEAMTDLTDDAAWHLWPSESFSDRPALVRRLDDTRYVAVVPFLFTWGVVVGDLESQYTYNDRWCYHGLPSALVAATVWSGEGEPDGWHRHPFTGRRRPEGDVEREYVNQ